MFQSFDATSRPEQGPPRLKALRDRLAAAGLHGFLVPRADAHQGEYVAPADERLAWLTGFTGSAGFCAVLASRAGVFVDGRYRVQVKAQVAPDFTPVDWPETQLADWLAESLPDGGTIGFDPWLHTAGEIEKLRAGLEATRVTLKETENHLDAVWPDRPGPPEGRVFVQPDDLAGETAAAKRARIAQALREARQDAAVLTLPDSINWLLNIRGEDIPRNPIVQCFAILHADASVDLFLAAPKAAQVAEHLGPEVRPRDPADFPAALAALTGRVRVDKTTAPLAVSTLLRAEIAWAPDPCLLPKARKNAAEIAATAEAHLRDGAAMAEFLAWLDAEAPRGGLTEIAVVRALEGFRRATNALRDISFDTIAGAGPNGAVIHYRVTTDTDRPLREGELIVVDSGGQYVDGTTDITRTVPIGQPTEEHRTQFTRVLQGMIAISRLRFPRGVAGAHIDALARYPLWLAGQDYDHGTGHGVGVFLSVHEGPARISRVSDLPLEPGMILSNEPGYYREGAFGIRIENLVVVEDAPPLEGADPQRKMRAFRTLTFVPIDRRLIDTAMLTPAERAWLDAYHRTTFDLIAPRLRPETRAWLEAATQPL